MLDPKYPRSDAERETVERLRSRMNVGRLIVRWRMLLGLTQEEIARRAGTKQSRISELESLHGNVRFDTLDRISRALGLEITLQPRDRSNAEGFVSTGSPGKAALATSLRATVSAGDTITPDRLTVEVSAGRAPAFV